MAAPPPRLRKYLSAPGLLKTIRRSFEAIADHRTERSPISLPDAWMSGLAVLGLKYPSLLKFDEAYQNEAVIRHNLRTLYGVERAPGDTQLRTILDPVEPAQLRPAYRAVHRYLQRHKALEAYEYLDGHYWVLIDGTGQLPPRRFTARYSHHLRGAVRVPPQRKTVLPLAPDHQAGWGDEKRL
jgi:hypothetical protein